MGPNQRGSTRCSQRGIDLNTNKGQVTIFIIVGLIVAAIFFFVISTTTQIQNDKLQSEKEKVVTKVFRKEALRIAVDDCLKDEMAHALITLGKQGGKFWAGEPGGTEAFQEGINGITVPSADGESKVMYGITKGGNNYPCIDGATVAEGEPKCQDSYKFPSQAPDVGYGNRPLLTKGYIESQLQSYMIARGGSCVERVLREKVNAATEIIKSEPKIEVSMTDEGINVKANYEMTLKIAGEEQFELTQFDFTYPTAFNRFLRAAITNPLKWDWKYADFKFDEATLTGESGEFEFASDRDYGPGVCRLVHADPILFDYYKCNKPIFKDDWDQLQIHLEKREAPGDPGSFGDDLFIYTVPIQFIAEGAEEAVDQYEFVIARQNRPPALDHISRNPCPGENGYDYLVVPGSSDLSTIEIIPRAYDPDEDTDNEEELSFIPQPDASGKVIPDESPDDNGFLTFHIVSKDKHASEDFQDVRMYFDNGLRTSVRASLMQLTPSDVIPPPLIISREDPLRLVITLPSDAHNIRDVTNKINVYFKPQNSDKIILKEGITLTTVNDGSENILSLPTKDGGELSSNSINDYQSFDIAAPLPYVSTLPEGNGELIVEYSVNYCGSDATAIQTATASIQARVVNCIAHLNDEGYVFSYPFNNVRYSPPDPAPALDYIYYVPDGPENPFTTTHSCCVPEDDSVNPLNQYVAGKYKGAGEPCGHSAPGCYGRIEEFTIDLQNQPDRINRESFKGYILEQQVAKCSGTRGNVCGDNAKYEPILDSRGLIICGDNQEGCGDLGSIPHPCKGKPAYSYQSNGWCGGTMGCSNYCSGPGKAVVSSTKLSTVNMDQVNINANTKKWTTDTQSNLHCGCNEDDVVNSNTCDSNFDGNFNGHCTPAGCDEVSP